MTYILYQSLETQCSQLVLTQLLDHFNNNVLVVGPVLDGHVFQAGQQSLNGRTTPWNTLALWSVRKLALTGFLRIADGFTQDRKGDENGDGSRSNLLEKSDQTEYPKLLGSDAWWTRQVSGEILPKQGIEKETRMEM